jgi:hypothetical protein
MHTDTKENEADLVSEKTIERTYQRKLLRSQQRPNNVHHVTCPQNTITKATRNN